MKPTSFPLAAALLTLLTSACGGSGTVPHENGGGPPADAGVGAGNPDAAPPEDGGPGDAGPEDAGPEDAGPGDAGATDAGPMDAGPGDAGPGDAGPVDAGPVDAGPVDPNAPFVAGRSSLIGDPSVTSWEPVDLNGDGKLDVVVKLTSFTTAFGNGDGAVAATGAFVPGSFPFEVAGHGDFDGDGKGDVVACFGNNGLQVFRGSATSPSGILDESMGTPAYAFGPTAYLTSCAAGDFTGDGKPDVATGTSAGTVEIGINTGSGLAKGAVYPGLTSVSQLVAFDVDGQHGPDLLAVDTNGPRLELLLSKGDGTFTANAPVALPAGVTTVVPFREASASVVLLTGGGPLAVATLGTDGSLGAPVSLGTTVYLSAAAGDLDGNGTVEIAAARLTGGYVDVYERAGAGWAVKQTLRPNWLPSLIKLVDWNGDGKLDLSMLNGGSPVTLDVLLNRGDGTFPSPPQTAIDAAAVNAGATGDLDGDGRPDVILPYDSIPNQSYADVYLTQPGGGFTKSTRVSLPNQASHFLVGDFTGDGKNDLVSMSTYAELTFLTGDGAGGLAATGGFYGPADAIELAAGDVAATGKPQLLVGAPGGINAYDAAASFFAATPHVVSTGTWPELLGVADVDGDGKQDLLMSGLFAGGFAWQRSLGAYGFGAPAPLGGTITVSAVLPLQLGALPRRWLVVEGDGLHDWQETASGVSTDTPLGGPAGSFIIRADWNHDGIEDLIVGGAVIALYRGQPGGTYTFTGTTLLGGGYANAVDFFDATGDGVKDIVVVNHYGGITVLPGVP